METLLITRKFRFEMAHQLEGHDGPCRNVHGHSYELAVTVAGKPLSETGNAKDGMVVDFSVLKAIVQKAVLDKLDHALLLKDNERSRCVKEAMLGIGSENVLLMPVQPTCENTLLLIKELLVEALPGDLVLSRVILRETPNTAAEWALNA